MTGRNKYRSDQPLDLNQLVGNLVLGVEEHLAEHQNLDELSIIRFVEEEVDLGIQLTLQQRTVLKAYYNLELTEEELSVLEYWQAKGVTTWNPKDGCYQLLILECGRRAGKSTIASLIATYEFYKLCRLSSPQNHYGISTNTPISILVLATTASQGKKTIFKAVVGTIRNTRFFQRLEQQGRLFVGKEEIAFEEKLLYIYSGNSQSGAQVGGTVKVLVMDEVARFKDSDGASNAIELWSNLGIATTTFGSDARRVAISSAWFDGDAIQQLYEASELDTAALGLRLRSWDMNPIHAARENPVVASEYLRDPVQAALEFEGVRPAAVDAFLNANEVKAAFRGRCSIQGQRYVDQDELGFNLVKVRVTELEPFTGSTVCHIDPAIGTDTYATAFGHNEFDEHGRQIVVIDGFLCWEPTHEAQVSITDVQKVILEVHRRRQIMKLSADHYNSVETVQRLRTHGIPCDIQYFSNTTQVSMYDLLRQLLHEQRIILPYNSPWTPLALSELCKVQLVKGRKIDHPSGGCFVEDTRIPLLDGTNVLISELVDKEVWVYSATPDGKIVPGRARGRKTKSVSKLLDVILDNGAVVQCTPEHPWMLRAGSYKAAKDLIPGVDRLMPMVATLKIETGHNPMVVEIIQIELESPVDVYDLEVDEWDNFALTAGVIVHNSKDVADCVAAICWNLASRIVRDSIQRKIPIKEVPMAVSNVPYPDFQRGRQRWFDLDRKPR